MGRNWAASLIMNFVRNFLFIWLSFLQYSCYKFLLEMTIYLKMSKMYVYFINIYYIYCKNIYNIYRLYIYVYVYTYIYIYKTIGAFYCFVFSFLEVVYTAGNDEYECCAVCFYNIIYSSKCLNYCKYYIHYRLACLF